MSLELRVSGGTRDGQRLWFTDDLVLLGRDPRSDLAFDPHRDRDVSARHAELRRRAGRWLVRDLNSTNGTYLNGARISGEAEVHDGDRIGCGAHGPVVQVRIPPPGEQPPAPPPAGAPAPASRLPRPRTAAIAAGLLLCVVAGGAAVVASRDAAPAVVGDSLGAAAALAPVAPSPALPADAPRSQMDSALAATQRERDELRQQLADLQGSGGSRSDTLTQRLQGIERRAALLAGNESAFRALVAANGPAVAMLAVEAADGSTSSGTAFGVHPRGVLVTNRHVVIGANGEQPRRVRVLFADTREWRPARVLRAAEGDDLALLEVEGGRPIPVVRGIAAPGTDPGVGAAVALIGFPLGFDLPMEERGGELTAKTTLGVGLVAKVLADQLQIDAYADHGSSGSPVFDRRGAVVGVVYGGARDTDGRVVYAVLGDRLRALLPDSLARRVR